MDHAGTNEDALAAAQLLHTLGAADRVRVLAALLDGHSSLAALGEATGLPAKVLGKEVVRLTAAGLVSRTEAGLVATLEVASDCAGRLVEGNSLVSRLPEGSRLRRWFRNGRLTMLPHNWDERVEVATLVTASLPAGELDEAELNSLLRPTFADVAALRRLLVDAGLLRRRNDTLTYLRA